MKIQNNTVMRLGLEIANTTRYNYLKKQDSNFTSLGALNFPSEYDLMCYYLIFHVPNFLIAVINQVNDQNEPFTTVQEK